MRPVSCYGPVINGNHMYTEKRLDSYEIAKIVMLEFYSLFNYSFKYAFIFFASNI